MAYWFGISSAHALWALFNSPSAPKMPVKMIVVVLPDSGERYLSTLCLRRKKG
jgi:cysteine synthase